MSRRRIPPRHRSCVFLPTLAEKVNRQQVLVYVLLVQLFTFTENVLAEQSFVTVGFLTRLLVTPRFRFAF